MNWGRCGEILDLSLSILYTYGRERAGADVGWMVGSILATPRTTIGYNYGQ